MEDLGDALNQQPDLIFMGGGNPAQLTAVEDCLASHIQSIANDPSAFHKLIGEYQPPQGDPGFRKVLAAFLSKFYSSNDASTQESACPISADNIAISNGGQSAFFSLFNMFAGYTDKPVNNELQSLTTHKRILLPMVPDYLGYADTGLDSGMFQSLRPIIEDHEPPFFKYKIDFDALELDENIAAVCLSRPANPSGNIVTDQEIAELKKRCRAYNIPLIIDLAYGSPFPDVTFVNHSLAWDEQTIFVLSLSKLGLPGVRTGIVIAAPDIIKRFSRATANLSLAPSNLGPALCKSLIQSGDLSRLIESSIRPYYHQKMQQTVDYLLSILNDLPVKIHKPEGAFFLWLWFQNLPLSSQQLYKNLKEKGVLILSGHHFFEPLGEDNWEHRDQCIRLSYCQPWEKIKDGIDILVSELNEHYR
jgi:valine--pyruvate aminotransferase